MVTRQLSGSMTTQTNGTVNCRSPCRGPTSLQPSRYSPNGRPCKLISYMAHSHAQNSFNSSSVATKTYKYECDPDGMVFRVCWRDSEGKVQPLKQLVVPVALQNSVIQYMHASTEGAHNKAWKTYYKTRERFWWSGMHKQIGEFVYQCPLCQLHGASQSKAPLAGHAQASRPGQAWVCDLIHYIPSFGGSFTGMPFSGTSSAYLEKMSTHTSKYECPPCDVM